jgi:hypothetical protein
MKSLIRPTASTLTKGQLVAHHLPHAQLGGVGDDGGRGFGVVGDAGGIARAGVAEQ